MSYEIVATGDAADAARIAATTTEVVEEKSEVTDPAVETGSVEKPEVKEGNEVTDPPLEDTPEAEYYFGDTQVEIEVPDDIKSAFEEKGIDVDSVVSELFAKEGEFKLSDETRGKLDEAFGKPLVDAYLNLYKGQNEMALKQYHQTEKEQQATMEANTKDFDALVGGDDGWNSMATWAGDNLSEAELASFNAVMNLPPEHFTAQRMVTESLKSRFAAAQADGQSDAIKLLTDDGAPADAVTSGLPQTLTRGQFQAEMCTEKYRKDSEYAAAIDRIRVASAAKGL